MVTYNIFCMSVFMKSDTFRQMNSTALGSEVITVIHTVVFGTQHIEIKSTDFCIMKCKLEGTSFTRFKDKSLPYQLYLGAEASWAVELPFAKSYLPYLPAGKFFLSAPPSSHSGTHGLRQLVNTVAQKPSSYCLCFQEDSIKSHLGISVTSSSLLRYPSRLCSNEPPPTAFQHFSQELQTSTGEYVCIYWCDAFWPQIPPGMTILLL